MFLFFYTMSCHSLLEWGKNSKSILVTENNDFNDVPVTQDIPIHRFPGDNRDHSLVTANISRLDKLMGLYCKGHLGLAMPLLFGRGGS